MIMKLTTLTSTDEAMTTFGSLMLQETPKLSVIKIDAHFSHLSFSKNTLLFLRIFVFIFACDICVAIERNIKATSAERIITFEVLKADFEPIHTLSKCTPTKNMLTDLSLDQQRGEIFIIPKNILEHFTSFMFRVYC